jgi:23S rRNA pseudouridine1911/1915/1917 synthase
MKLKILYEDNHIIVVEKRPNIPVQADESKDMDMSTIIKQYLKKQYNKTGNVYLGMVHRLDRPVGGVMVFAKTSKAAARLSEEIRNNNFKKKYLAIVHDKPINDSDSLEHYLLKDKDLNTSRVVSVDEVGAKRAILFYNVIRYDQKSNTSMVEIDLITGRHHQIRVQFSAINHPIVGDQRYGIIKEKKEQIKLWSYQISFKHPVKNETVVFDSKPKWFLGETT